MNKKRYYWLLAFGIVLSACHNRHTDFDATGTFEATEITVSAEANGKIMSLDLEEGDRIQAGSIVGYIDSTQLYLRKKQLEAGLRSIDIRKPDIQKQIASLEQQIAVARSEQKRMENLVAAKVGNQKQLDDINARLATLEKQLAAQTETLENGNRTVSGQVRMLEAQLAQVEDQIVKCRISSPINGTILSKYAEAGELASQGRALFKVGDIVNMYLRAYITADQLTELKIGQSVRVFADEGESGRREYAGTVSWISDKAEFTPKTIQTRDERANLVYAVKIQIQNDGFVKRGMYGEIKID